MKRLTTLSKVLIVLFAVAIAAVACLQLGLFDFKPGGAGNRAAASAANPAPAGTNNVSVEPTQSAASGTIRISLDEWIGWKSILDANGGLKTKQGSIFDELGLDLEISIINDATQSSTALIRNSLDGAGYTVNRYAFLYPKFMENDVPVKMSFITNSSTGGDGIIAKSAIASVEDLAGKKIAVPRFSEAQTLVEWLINSSGMSDRQRAEIRDAMVMFETPDDAAKAFFAGQVDAAATWEPYLSQAQSTVGARVLFSTKVATNIILDGIVFREDYLAANPESVQKFIEGTLMAQELYNTDFTAIKEMPLFSTETDESIREMTGTDTLSSFGTNRELLGGVAQSLYVDMCKIWTGLGETAQADTASQAFESTNLLALAGRFDELTTQAISFTEADRATALSQEENQALLKTTLSISFEPNLAVIREESYPALLDFANTAKILNGAIIQVEGNIADIGVGDNDEGRALSMERAKAVANYLQMQGVDGSRFVVIGNGITKPVGDNSTEEGMQLNRRTDILFKLVE